ncbi:MAG: DoxX family protein [Chloroflexi bacterium]|nr:DoxX family protein [Chloroflexota bacterium]
MHLHVAYVTEPEPSPDPIGFLVEALSDPFMLLVLGLGAIMLLALVGAWARVRPLEPARERFVRRAETYRPYVPWMLRLAVGLVVIGAGLGRVLFVPNVPLGGWPHLVLTAIGFLLLLGLAVRPAALLALAVYLVALVLDARLSLIFDVAGGLAAIAFVGPGAPSLDDLLRAAFPRAPGGEPATRTVSEARYDDLVPLLVRIGLGGALVASGIGDKLLIYEQALDSVAKYHLTSVVPVSPELWVIGASALETSLGVAILVGVLTRFGAVLGFAVLTLAVFALADDPVIFHVGLFGLASVLVVLGGGRWSADAILARRFGRPRPTPEVTRA